MIEGFARLVLEDENSAVYEYSGLCDCPFEENGEIVHKYDRTKITSYDGIFTVYKEGLEEPEIHTKLKKRANGRKEEVIKRVPHFVRPMEKLERGLAVIDKECVNAYKGINNDWQYDKIAVYLLKLIYEEYQTLGHVPEETVLMSPEEW